MTEAEFLALPESCQGLELIDGRVIVSPSPSFRHQKLLGRLARALQTWIDVTRAPTTVAQSPLDVRFAPGRILQPDAMVFDIVLPDDVRVPIDWIPMICIEVLSESAAHDRVTKRQIYAATGVREYWIVDPTGSVEVCAGPKLTSSHLAVGVLHSALLPGFVLDLDAFFA